MNNLNLHLILFDFIKHQANTYRLKKLCRIILNKKKCIKEDKAMVYLIIKKDN